MRKFIILERDGSGSDRDFEGTSPDLTDTYEVEGTLQDALDRLARLVDDLPSYRFRLTEVIQVDVERNVSQPAGTIATFNGVRVSTTAK